MLSYDQTTKTIGAVTGVFDPANKAVVAFNDSSAGLTSADLSALSAFVPATYYAVTIQ